MKNMNLAKASQRTFLMSFMFLMSQFGLPPNPVNLVNPVKNYSLPSFRKSVKKYSAQFLEPTPLNFHLPFRRFGLE